MRFTLVLIIICAALSAVGAAAGSAWGSQRERPCASIHAPVCGVRGALGATFGNACQATAQGFEIVAKGACTGTTPLLTD